MLSCLDNGLAFHWLTHDSFIILTNDAMPWSLIEGAISAGFWIISQNNLNRWFMLKCGDARIVPRQLKPSPVFRKTWLNAQRPTWKRYSHTFDQKWRAHWPRSCPLKHPGVCSVKERIQTKSEREVNRKKKDWWQNWEEERGGGSFSRCANSKARFIYSSCYYIGNMGPLSSESGFSCTADITIYHHLFSRH